MNPDLYYESSLSPEEAAELDKFREAVLVLPNNGPRDWVEDFTTNSGTYQCRCIYCEQLFIGYKRRITCKVCHNTNQDLLAAGKATLSPARKPEAPEDPNAFIKVPDHLKDDVADLPSDFMKVFTPEMTAGDRIDYLMKHSRVFRMNAFLHPSKISDMIHYILSEMSPTEPTEDEIQSAEMAFHMRVAEARKLVEAQSKSLGGVLSNARVPVQKRVSKSRKKK